MGEYDDLIAHAAALPDNDYSDLIAAAGQPNQAQQIAAGLGRRPPENRHNLTVNLKQGTPLPPTPDEALGIDEGPLVTRRAFGGSRGAAYLPTKTMAADEAHERKMAQGELGGDPTAQFVVGGVLGAGLGGLAGGGLKAAGAPAVAGDIGGGVVSGAGVTALSGGDLSDIAKGAIVGGVMSALPAASAGVRAGAKKLRTKLRDPRTEMGHTISELDKAKASGHLEDPSFQALPNGARGYNRAALEAEQNIAGRTEADLAAERAYYSDQQKQFLDRAGDRYHYIPDTEAGIAQIERDNTASNGYRPKAKQPLFDALDDVRKMTTMDTGIVVGGERPGVIKDSAVPTVETLTAPAVRLRDLAQVKQIVDDLAEHGMPATRENVPYRQLGTLLRNELAGADPELAALNQRYHEAMNKAEETNTLMYGKDAAQIARMPAKQRQAAGMLGRIGDDTQPATLSEPQIQRLAEMDPRNAVDIERVAAKKAIERTRYGLPRVSRRIAHLPYGFLEQNAAALGARVLDPLLGAAENFPTVGVPNPVEIAAGLGSAGAIRRRFEEAQRQKENGHGER